MVTNTNLETGRAFVQLLDVNKDYNAAAQVLVDNFEFSSPKFKAKGKDEWLTKFPEMHKDTPIFGDLEEGDHELQLICKGSKKVGFSTFPLKELLEFNADGKVANISAAKA